MNANDIIREAIEVRTDAQAQELQAALEASIGGRYTRPLGDVWNNFGLMSHGGDFDHKTIENVTNAQDAILEREARKRFASLDDVPYRSPHEAAAALLRDQHDLERRIQVDFHEPSEADLADKRVTMKVRDDGCGITPGDIASTIFQLGSSHKSEILWQQGAFGVGAKSTFRNAHAVVVVSRRAPEMQPTDDRITVAVVQWEQHGKGTSAYYLTTDDWDDNANPDAEPWSVPASVYPDFGPGTQITLVSYGVRGLHRRYSGDERAFHAIAQTRLYRPVIPFRHTSYLVKKPEPRTVRGLEKALVEQQAEQLRDHGSEPLPFHLDGVTYQLPVEWWVFPAAANEPCGRNSLVAAQHVVVFTSGGQVHKHWDTAEFRERTRLTKLDSRIFAAVDTDPLPINVRTSLFTPDRSDLVPTGDAIRLEEAVAAHLQGSHELITLNAKLLRAEVERALGNRNTREVAQRISRAFRLRSGFGLGSSNGNGRPKKPKPRTQIELYAEPTFIEGPEHTTLRPGDTRSLTFYLNTHDEFMDSGRGTIVVNTDHPALSPGKEIAIGALRNGRLRVILVIPDTAELGDFTIMARLPEWHRRSGGLAGPLSWETKMTVTDAPPSAPPPPPNGGATDDGGEIALLWVNGQNQDWGLTPNVPGTLEDVPASILAASDDYHDLAQLGDAEIKTIVLNEDFADYKKYVGRLASARKTQSVDRAKDKYAQGVGVGLLVLDEQAKKSPLDDDQRKAAAHAIARATLSLLPAFDDVMSKIEGDTD
jgi:hypothetical protein